MNYPDTKEEAHKILNAVQDGLIVSEHLIRYCLCMTGDL